MPYIFESSNSIKFVCFDLEDGSIYETLTFDGFSNYNPKNENKYTTNPNQEILIDSIGMRMEIEVSLVNRDNINTQGDFLLLFDCINKVQQGTHRIMVFPSYDIAYEESSLEYFQCIMDGYYDIEKLHKFLKAGQEFTFKFKEYVPQKNYVPKVPRLLGGITGSRQGRANIV